MRLNGWQFAVLGSLRFLIALIRPVMQCFSDMPLCDSRIGIEVCDRSRHLEDAMISAG